ncbi:Co/Ni ABC transporter CbiKLMQO, membrane protein CbiQ [Campylobacter iguaniorum]|uniref:energy-coupling factor transporter transmembrane component T n=1 Tax=Campylobacter iguaniorum TaxID=1244531 RepID=UPI0007C89DF6|nr:energy-coupling factor transporter transmembrane component T [Campylobacter iguaniorum]ANE35232.1 Co/Ni ABC transporter CbiKLMQO, membrane protein CbiQ [Campylobacter iguaniorum]
MNLPLALVCLVLFSFKVALSEAINLSFFFPVFLLMIFRFKEILVIFKRLIFLNLFVALVALSVILYGDLHQAGVIFLRSNLIIFFSLLIFHSRSAFDVATSLHALKVSNKMSAIVYFCAKFIGEFRNEFLRLKKTLKVRGFESKTSLFTYKIYANLVAMLFLNAFDKAQILEKTFIIRNFSGKFYHHTKQKVGIFDIILLLLCCFIYFLNIKVVL